MHDQCCSIMLSLHPYTHAHTHDTYHSVHAVYVRNINCTKLSALYVLALRLTSTVLFLSLAHARAHGPLFHYGAAFDYISLAPQCNFTLNPHTLCLPLLQLQPPFFHNSASCRLPQSSTTLHTFPPSKGLSATPIKAIVAMQLFPW